MAQMIFDQQRYLDNNIFKFENRLHSRMNKYIENGAMLVTYFSLDQNSSTVDRGLQNIEKLFGKESPLRYNMIEDFPLYGFGQANPENTDENNMNDFTESGQCYIIPSTIMPRVNDYFIIKHLKQDALFKVTGITYDSMKQDGFYKLEYVLQSTDRSIISALKTQVVDNYHTELSAIGSKDMDPIIKEDDFNYRNRILQMMNQMMLSYKALFYNERHNCFLYHDPNSGLDWFDTCANEFMAKYGLINPQNSMSVVVLHDKLKDSQFPYYYNHSIYKWIELDAPVRFLSNFFFKLKAASFYPYSSFSAWGDKNIQIIIPLSKDESGINTREYSYFDNDQLNAFLNPKVQPNASEYDLLIWKFINQEKLLLKDISLYTADSLLNSTKYFDTYFYTPIIIYIIKKILRMN